MSSINPILFSMFPTYASQVNGGGTTAQNGATTSGYGDAIQLTLSQQQNSDGSDTYDISLYGYSPATGDQLISQSASGATASDAFDTLISSLSGLGDPNQSGSTANELTGQFNELDGSLTENFGTKTGSVNNTVGFENTPKGLQGYDSSSVTADISSSGQVTGASVQTTPLTPQQMQEQTVNSFNSILHNPVSQMTNTQSMSYINSVIQSLQSANS
jgi:hypothetical protein